MGLPADSGHITAPSAPEPPQQEAQEQRVRQIRRNGARLLNHDIPPSIGAAEIPARGLPKRAAIQYLGLKRRAFDRLAGELCPFRAGTSLLYDVRDLDFLFDRLKAASNRGMASEVALVSASPAGRRARPVGVSSALDRRPSEKGVRKWVVKAASMKMPQAGGESTESIAVNAFKAVSTRIKMQKPG